MKINNNLEFGTTIALWSQCSDRFLSQGYKPSTSFSQKIELISKIDDIKGVDLYGDWDVNPENISDVKKTLADYGLKAFIVTADVASLPEFGRGSVTSPIKESRELGWKKIAEAIDMAKILECPMVDLWLGQDGYDYPFQVDYKWGWEKIIDTIKDAADYAASKDIKIALEYKPREPRTHLFTASAASMLMVVNKVAKDNVGVLIDTGHAYMAGENIAESVALCNLSDDKLFYVHLNDNYKVWDDDMMVGSIHPFELIEFLYWLERLNYSGPLVLDMFPYREDPLKAATESIEFVKQIRERIKELDEEKIEEILTSQDATASIKMLRKHFLK
jgi:sugar phosphate isomerase/epimerase